MANKGRATFAKRQKEIARQERAREKAAKRVEKVKEKVERTGDYDPDIAGIIPGPQPLPYAASKAAVVNLTKTLAWNLGPEIRVNAVAPGWMEGDWMKRMLKDKYDDLMAKRARATPLGRVVTADDVAQTMLSLIQSNRFVTGEVIVIDGGFASST